MRIAARKMSRLQFLQTAVPLVLALTAAGCGGGGSDPSTSSATRSRVACIGDSITYGAGIENYRTDAYPPQLGKLLGSGNVAGNFGVPGATMLAQGDNPYNRTEMFRQVERYLPDTVVIELGTNDSKPHNWQHKALFARDAAQFIAQLRQIPTVRRIFICLPPPVFADGAFGISRDVLRQEVTPLLLEVAHTNNVGVIDLYTPLLDEPELFQDGVHPTPTGAGVIAQAVYAVLQVPVL